MNSKTKLGSLLNSIFLLFPMLFFVSTVKADIIRFNFDTESFFNRTAVSNGFTHNSDGSGNAFGSTGLNGSVTGSIDINRSATGESTISNYLLQVIMPHGIAPGFNFPQWTIQYSSSTLMQPGAGATALLYSNGYMFIQQEFMFDPFYGPATPQNTWYNPLVRQEYLFRVDLMMSGVPGAGPNGGLGLAVDRVDVRCAVPGDARLTCNGFGSVGESNYSDWDSTEGLASSFEILPSNPQDPAAPVPAPSTLSMMLLAFAGLLVSRRRTLSR
ncbi:PEP-CTERM sorting domain-containing protein [Alishewanella sp. 16-MA]|uniref:PEP-CTERM sorting domain-containing protein n=2 Tax=Alishewanella TaxID=111142 RepID=A0ABS8C214_9ALTE|nr:PEP-CTERM sorting domain-containing protein [Alishewanella maricola]MCB5226356.1 PEP-CTERM sorting domain-containing protein [Alishewanella maricola]